MCWNIGGRMALLIGPRRNGGDFFVKKNKNQALGPMLRLAGIAFAIRNINRP